ncbi:MAG: SMC family ATPase [Epsilonproteobacteria bacterium]|nr:SMC family ATPase [Campylobacterota bacterium]
MIPRILELKNFLSYGNQLQTVDFKNHSLICLSGKNGHGKSALLDGITWSLWGQARKISSTSKADDGLLHLGQTRMMVSFEFESSGTIYRTRREYARTHGKPYAALDFEVFDHEQDRFVSLTDKTIRATQVKIEKTIGLDFATFINSSFLRQGQSNEFSKKSPKERKQIIATILGLEKYDLLQQQALDKTRSFQEKKRILLQLQEQRERELAQRSELTNARENEQKKLAEGQKLLDQLQTKLKQTQTAYATLEATKKNLERLHLEQQELAKTAEEKIKRFDQLRKAWQLVHARSLKQSDFPKLEKEKKDFALQEQKLLEHKKKQLLLQEKLLSLKEQLAKKQAELKQEIEQSLHSRRRELEKQQYHAATLEKTIKEKEIAQATLVKKINEQEKSLNELAEKLKSYEQEQKEYELVKTQFEKRKNFYQLFVQKGKWLQAQLSEFEHKKNTLNDPDNPACPLCEQLITQRRKQFLAQQMASQEQTFAHQHTRIYAVVKKLKALLLEQHELVKQKQAHLELLTKQQAQHKECQTQHIHMQTELAQLKQLQTDLAKEKNDLEKPLTQASLQLEKEEKTLLASIGKHQAITELEAQLKQLEKEKAAIPFDEDVFTHIQQELTRIAKELASFEQLRTELGRQDQRKESISTLRDELKAIKVKQANLTKECNELTQQTKQAAQLEAIKTAQEAEHETLLKAKETHLQAIGSFDAQLKRLDQLEKDNAKQIKELDEYNQEIDDYQELALAFSKNGIQALLIEDAVPEIEQEANDILARLTDNQAQIFIESLRDLKKGGVRETLDIHITDTLGSRAYEMFSGGEAFRIDFALRIAISKLLARRAGTTLQTLIIDEGFGSQDEDGLAHIMACIHAIQSDFAKIIVVSHLHEFKDNFPAHLVVEKLPSGSVVRLEERG